MRTPVLVILGLYGLVLGAYCLVLGACHGSPVFQPYGCKMPTFPDQCYGGLHPGVDFRAPAGAAVRASASGIVVSVHETVTGGGVVLLEHPNFQLYTSYAHLDLSKVRPMEGDLVFRGQVIGQVGVYRNSGPTPHVHLELCTSACPWGHPDCELDGTEDPLALAEGCFVGDTAYPSAELVLTYPVDC